MRASLLLVITLLLACGCEKPKVNSPSSETANAPAGPQPAPAVNTPLARLLLAKPDPAATPHLHNLLQLTSAIYSGSEPDGDEGFAELAKLGVKTIVSVDGARPNIDAAKKYGLRYVHIPFGYDGIPAEAGQALARVIGEANAASDTIYFHCHHGQHRGPAAAAVACIAANVADHESAQRILEVAGTGKDYAGLWRDVAAYVPPSPGTKLPELVEVAQVGSLATAMSGIDRAFDNLKLSQAANWKTLPEHPDLYAPQEALLVKEAFHESGRTLSTGRDAQFVAWLREAESLAEKLETQLKANDSDGAKQTLINVTAACKRCHEKYRN